MTTDLSKNASMGRLLAVYVTALLFGVLVCVAVLWALARYTNASYPVGMLFILLPMIAAMQSGGSFFKQAGRAASFGFACVFGLISTLILLVGVIALWQAGYLDPILVQVDPVAFQQGEIAIVLMPLLIVVAGIGLFGNVLMFWAGARAQLKQQERKDRLAARKS